MTGCDKSKDTSGQPRVLPNLSFHPPRQDDSPLQSCVGGRACTRFSRALPMKHDQFTLPFLDTTVVAEGFGLYGGFPTAKSSAHAQIDVEPEEAELLDSPIPAKPSLPARDYRLAGERCLAEGWKARAEDNLAAIRLMTTIEAEARHARPDEQERLGGVHAAGGEERG